MNLEILYKNGTKTCMYITTIWQDRGHGMESLYYELPNDEIGKGTFVSLDTISCWRIKK